jgi:uncharacterized protein DUF5655/uncharacterized protein DUF4287
MPSVAKKKSSLYGVHPGIAMMQKWIAELKEKTGRSLDEWIAFCNKSGPKTEAERRDWLKKEHGLGTNGAWWIAERVEGKGGDDDSPERYLAAAERYVETMFAGSKAGLRPIYDVLLKLGLSVADDVKACPCQTIVPLYRNHVFAQIKPTTRTRIDFGLALAKHKGTLPARLIDTGGLARKDRITHRIAITNLDDIDAEVKKWLKIAYELDE